MDNSTHTARLLKACNISIEQLLSFALTSRHLTSRQRDRLALISGAFLYGRKLRHTISVRVKNNEGAA